MKQSTVKTLGVAALGAVFAAVGTGAAQAAAPDPTGALGPAAKAPTGLQSLSPAVQTAQKLVGSTGPSRQVRQLIGGMPTDGLSGALPASPLGLG